MTGPEIDYGAVYRQLPLPVLLLTPEFTISDANQAYLDATGRTREQLLGRNAFEAFPDNPADPHPTEVHDAKESMARAVTAGKPDFRSFLKYAVEVPGRPGIYAQRYWNIVNAPVFGRDGQIVLIAHCAEELTERVSKFLIGLVERDVEQDIE